MPALILGSVLGAGLLATAVVASAESKADDELYEKLQKTGPESVAALDGILKRSDRTNAAFLYMASGVALREKRLEDAGFLYFAAEIRSRFDMAAFAAKGTGGNSPGALLAALHQTVGGTISPAVTAEPKIFARVLRRVKTWNPKIPEGYFPGWEFTAAKTEKEAREAIRDGRNTFERDQNNLCTLLQDDLYFAAFKTVQAYNLRRGTERPSKESYDAAVQTIESIEKQKGIAVYTAAKKS
jgi:hypothetical protein